MTPLYRRTFGGELSLHDAKVIAVETHRSEGEAVGTATFRIYDRAIGADAEAAFRYVVEFQGVSEGFAGLERGMEIYTTMLGYEGGTCRLELTTMPEGKEISFSFHRLTEKSLEPTN